VIRRRLFNVATAASLLLCVATAVMWLRSYWVNDRLTRGRGPSDCLLVFSDDGWLRISMAGDVRAAEGHWSLTSESAIAVRKRLAEVCQDFLKTSSAGFATKPEANHSVTFLPAFEFLGTPPPPSPFAFPGVWYRSFAGWLAMPTSPIDDSGPQTPIHILEITWAWPTIIGSILPLIWLGRHGYWRWRMQRGLCHACGYNLTANTSGICPECGTSVPNKPGVIA
jgi:hypothetical protein